MKVYKVNLDVDNYQGLFLDAENSNASNGDFDCTRKLDGWVPPTVFSLHPKLKAGDFWAYWDRSGTMVTTPQATAKLGSLLEIAGEVLPLPFDGQTFSLVNILECVNCLNTEKSIWFNKDRKIGRPQKYVFHPNRFTTTLFKIPETCSAEILALEREEDPFSEFKAFVEAQKMTGINFKEIWSG